MVFSLVGLNQYYLNGRSSTCHWIGFCIVFISAQDLEPTCLQNKINFKSPTMTKRHSQLLLTTFIPRSADLKFDDEGGGNLNGFGGWNFWLESWAYKVRVILTVTVIEVDGGNLSILEQALVSKLNMGYSRTFLYIWQSQAQNTLKAMGSRV